MAVMASTHLHLQGFGSWQTNVEKKTGPPLLRQFTNDL